jgi:hypothetical protein
VMGAKGAVEIIFRGHKDTTKEVEEYTRLFANPLTAAHRGFVDDIILPRTTRTRMCAGLGGGVDTSAARIWRFWRRRSCRTRGRSTVTYRCKRAFSKALLAFK